MTRLSLLAVFVAVLLAGCNRAAPVAPPVNPGNDQQSKKEVPQNDPKKNEVPKSKEKRESIVVTPSTLIKEFATDKATAAKKYDKQSVEITGYVFQPLGTGTTGFAMMGDAKEADYDAKSTVIVGCDLEPSIQYKVRRFVPGQKVKVTGDFVEFRFDRILFFKDCNVVSLEAEKVFRISAMDLAKELEADIQKTKMKYESQPLFVSGKLLSTGKTASMSIVTLSGTEKTNVIIGSPIGYIDDFLKLKSGQDVEVRAEVSSFFDKEGIYFQGGMLLPAAK